MKLPTLIFWQVHFRCLHCHGVRLMVITEQIKCWSGTFIDTCHDVGNTNILVNLHLYNRCHSHDVLCFSLRQKQAADCPSNILSGGGFSWLTFPFPPFQLCLAKELCLFWPWIKISQINEFVLFENASQGFFKVRLKVLVDHNMIKSKRVYFSYAPDMNCNNYILTWCGFIGTLDATTVNAQ